MISIDDFAKVEIKVGEILSAEKVPNADKLLRLVVHFGPAVCEAPIACASYEDIRQIVSGIAMYFPDPQVLVGKKTLFVTNLEPRVLRGLSSNGMLFALSSGEVFQLIEVDQRLPRGTKAK